MLSLASFSSFQLISLLPSDWPDPGWGVLELRSASEPARSAGKGDWKHVRWSKPWNKFFIWPNPRNLSRQKIWRGWRGPSAPPEHKEAQIRTKRKEKQNCIYIYTRGWNKNVKCRYALSTHTLVECWITEKCDQSDIIGRLWYQLYIPLFAHDNTLLPLWLYAVVFYNMTHAHQMLYLHFIFALEPVTCDVEC